MGAPKLFLVDKIVEPETIAQLEVWLEEARRGELVGLGGFTVYRGREYDVHAVGEAARHPTLSQGMACKLFFHLGRLADEIG